MANTYTNINDTKVMEDAVKALNHGLTRQNVFTMDVGSSPAEKAATIYVPVVTARTAGTYSTTYEDGNTSVVSASVTVSTHVFSSWHVTEAQAAVTRVKTFEASAIECAYALAAYVQNTVFNAVTASNFGNTANTDKKVVAAADFDADALADLRNICVKTNKWRELSPGYLGGMLLDGAYITNLLKDPALRDISASGDSAILRQAKLGNKYGIDIYENNVIAGSTPGSGSENLVGFICQPSALAVAVRPIQPLDDRSYAFTDIATDPESGVSMTYKRWVNTATGDLWGTFAVIMGVGVVDANRLVRIVSA